MSQIRKFVQLSFSSIIVLSLGLSLAQPQFAFAQRGDGIKRQVNAESGKVSFIGPESGSSVPAAKALGLSTFARPADPAIALAKRFAPEFGLKNPERDLSVKKTKNADDGRLTVRYQQNYQGIPVMGGELIVNTNANGDLYSMNGEVSTDLSLSTQPMIDSEQAKQTALQAMAKWYQKSADNFLVTEPELWIYDESLLRSSTRPAELVWRMEVTSVDNSLPLRELVLVNAQRGNISLHFNQIDTAWHSSGNANTAQTSVDSTIASALTNSEMSTDIKANQNTTSAPYALVGMTWYVATTGNDSNSCSSAASPCATINTALGKATTGDTIKVAVGVYTSSSGYVANISKSITLSGGWNNAFSSQIGFSTLDGDNANNHGIWINTDLTIFVSRFVIQNSYYGIQNNGSTLSFDQGALIKNNNGIYNLSGNTTFTNTTISGNHASGTAGSAIGNINGTINIQYSTITNNTGNYAIYSVNYGANIEIGNSILAGNADRDCGVGDSNLTSNGHNIFGSSPACDNFGMPGLFVPDPTDQVGVNPKLHSLFPGGYHPPLTGSPAINAADLATCPSTDQRGITRPQEGMCDIGAYEHTNTSGPATNLAIASGNGQRATITFPFSMPLQVVAYDNQGNPVKDITVTFTAPGSSASSNFMDSGTNTTTSVTNIDGIAQSSILTANSSPGTYNIIGSASGLGTANFTLTNAAWYVSTTGNDSNSCQTQALPCLTINGSISKALVGDTIFISSGTYTSNDPYNVVTIEKNIKLSGGWNSTFTIQNGFSAINGQFTRRGLVAVGQITTIDHFIIENGVGAAYINGGTVTINNSVIRNNTTQDDGGGIYATGNLTINNSTITGNSSTGDLISTFGGSGGGIISYGQLIINNSTIYGNTAFDTGGGVLIYENEKQSMISNSTIIQNHADQGGGVYVHNINSPSILSSIIRNTIMADNSADSNSGNDCYGNIGTSDHNIIRDASYCTANSSIGDISGVNPQLSPSSIGSPEYYPPLLGSPAIDTGNPMTCLLTDQRGMSRPEGLYCDIGAVEYQFNQSSSLLITTYSSGNTSSIPGTFICDQTDLNCAAGDSHAKAAHKYAAGTYNLYKNSHNRNSIDGNGIEMISTVHYRSNYQNAFWNGYMMIYGDGYGFSLADDVVAHELTHGVTQYESNLFPYYQSGAISESLSDLWGEYYDQTNGQGNDAAAVKWLLGEDTTGLGAIRNMSNPTAFSDPDKMSSTHYYEGQDDSGGVHTNSGINNKAIFLMVDGGTFNGKTISPLGWDKTAAIYYEVNTNLLSSGADYSDLYYALQQACSTLIGQKGITAANCIEVKDAIDAVEMNSQPAPNFNTDAPLCSAGTTPIVIFGDDLESGTSKWTFNNGTYTRWQYDAPYGQYAHSGQHSLYADDYPDLVTDATARLASFVVSSNAYLHFAHAYDFEAYLPPPGPYYYDGGVLEYSINGGSSWMDAGPLMNFNSYDGVIENGYSNPLSGRAAFAGSSHGYISTRLNLASLAGKTVTFRWRMGLDESYPALGWWVDDIKVYTCDSPANVSVLIGGASMGNYVLQPKTSLKKSYVGVDGGPVRVQSNNGTKIVASERVAYSPDGGATWTSHAELMGLPANLVSTSYTFPWYNNFSLDSQLRIGNVGAVPTNVTVTIGGQVQGTYTLNPSASRRVSYPDLDKGPVVIQSNGQPIIASLRVAYTNGTAWTSFSEMMGLPSNMLTNSYTFPWYNNLTLDSQLRFGNVGTSPTNVTVTIAGQVYGPYTLQPNESKRIKYPALDKGPVKVTSSGNVPIIASMRVAYHDGTAWTDFSEMMGLPTASLSTHYSFPAYNNVNLNSQLRFGNVGTANTNVTVTIGGVAYGPYTVAPNASRRISYPLNSGPVVIQSSGGVPIIASLRVAYTPDGGVTWTSFSEMMGLPQSQLTTSYLFPWYNNVGLDTQLRFGVP